MRRIIQYLFAFISFSLLGGVFFAQENNSPRRVFKVEAAGELVVRLNAGDIKINPTEKNECVISPEEYEDAEEVEDEETPEFKCTQQGNKIMVSDNSKFRGETSVKIEVPKGFNLKLRTMSGDISVSSALKGNVSASTSGGDISVSELTGEAELNTSGGDIEIGSSGGVIALNTMGGDIKVGVSGGAATLNTMGGDIKIGTAKESLNAKTYGGNVSIGKAGGDVNAESYGGDVSIGFVSGAANLSTKGGDIICKGGEGSISANTASGDIILKNFKGSVNAITAYGDINAELIPSGKGASKLSTNQGDINLYLQENSRATVNAHLKIRGGNLGFDDENNIYSDFKAEKFAKDSEGKDISATYNINGGGEIISLKTINSDIHIINSDKNPMKTDPDKKDSEANGKNKKSKLERELEKMNFNQD